MNNNILRAIESLCYDIATSAKAEENQKRANAVLALAFAGKFTPEEIKKAIEKELHKGLYPDFLREAKP